MKKDEALLVAGWLDAHKDEIKVIGAHVECGVTHKFAPDGEAISSTVTDYSNYVHLVLSTPIGVFDQVVYMDDKILNKISGKGRRGYRTTEVAPVEGEGRCLHGVLHGEVCSVCEGAR